MKSNYRLSLFAVVIIFCQSAGNAQSYRRGLTMITPASQWREALPAGNGTMGAMVYGSIGTERILFNHNELWYDGKVSDIPDLSAELPVVRQFLLDGKYKEAHEHYRREMENRGFDGRQAKYHPAFDLILSMERELLFEDYSRTLDFETGEIEVKWRDGETSYSRRLFVSIPDSISVMSIKSNQKNAVNGELTLDIHDLKDALLQNGMLFDPGFSYQTRADNNFVEFLADGSDGGEFGGVMKVIAKNGIISSSKGDIREPGGSVKFKNADEVLVLVAIYANKKSEVAVPRLRNLLAAVDTDYDTLFYRHKALHGERFNSMGVTLNVSGKRDTPNESLLLEAYQKRISTELAEKLFDYGRYLLISSSRSGGYPANLQGLWNGDYRPPWNSLYGINENIEMNYWQALPGNLKESMMAFYDYFDAHMDEFRYNARQLWGCRGIYIPPFMAPISGILVETQPHVVNWTDAAGWLSSFYYDYYLFTGDREFLRNRAVPFLKETALFYEDFIVKDEHGKNMLFPSQSPENQPANMVYFNEETGRQERMRVQINATMAIAISKEVLTNLVKSCELLGIEQEGVKRWKAILADMPEYQINEDGAIREWMHPDFKDNYEHRHQSHIYPLFPGQEITEESNPKFYEACRIAIEKRLTIGLKSQTGWSLAHMANVYARLGDGDKAKEALDILSRCCLGQNLFTYHNDWRNMGVTLRTIWGNSAPFQMDANFGVSAAITEMLCGSNADMLRILPALPTDWKTGEFHDMLTRAGIRTSAKWDMNNKEIDVTLVAERDAAFHIKFPGEVAHIESSQPKTLMQSEYGDNYRAVSLEKGEGLTIQVKLR